MACLLIPHSHFDVFAFVTGNAFCPKLLTKFLLQLLIPRNQTRFEHGSFRHHVGIGGRDRFFNRAGGVAYLEANVPEEIQHLLDDLASRFRYVATMFAMQKHHVDIATWVQLTPAVATESDQCDRRRAVAVVHDMTGRGEDVAQQHIDQINPTGTNFAPAIARAVAQAQTVLLDFQKLPIDRKNVGRPLRSCRSQFALRMGQNFFEVARHQSSLRTAIFRATAVVYVVVAAPKAFGAESSVAAVYDRRTRCAVRFTDRRYNTVGQALPLVFRQARMPA